MPVKVLYIEDDQEQVDSVTSILQHRFEDVEVQSASDGLEGVRKARDWRPDLILVDLVIPGADGIEVISQLRRDEAIEDVPIVAISAWVGAGTQFNDVIRRLGANEVLTKPVEAEQFADIVALYARGLRPP